MADEIKDIDWRAEPKANILLVDDRPEGLLALQAVLNRPDYNLIKAQSGQEALSFLSSYDFAVILLDVQMPVMDGFQTATLIKQRPQWKDIPIIFVTALHKDTPYIHEGYRAGAVDYFFKPFDPYILRSKVAVFVDLYRKNIGIRRAQEEIRQKEEELHQVRKLEAIGRLAGGVAHDFNNIIAGILGIQEEFKESLPANDSRQGNIDESIKACHRAFSLIRQLLAYGRRQVISPHLLDLNSVVSDMRGMLQRLIGEDVELRTALEPALWPVAADRGYMEQILTNLVLNARDAMPQGGIATIKTANAAIDEESARLRRLNVKPGDYVLLVVNDTGCGMSEDVLAHVFEPFFTTKGDAKGNGLGLATVYGIVKQLDGEVALSSRPDAGTTMEIYLPRSTQRAHKPAAPVPRPVPPRGSETIMVVEDEPLVRSAVAGILRKNGYKVLEARNGPDALDLAARTDERIDLLITDIIMPDMNGRQMAGLFLANHPETGVLYMSGYPEDVIAHRGILEPGIAFIEKSAISGRLAETVRQTLSARLKHPRARRPAEIKPAKAASAE